MKTKAKAMVLAGLIFTGVCGGAVAQQNTSTWNTPKDRAIPYEFLTQTASINPAYADHYRGFYNARFPGKIRAVGYKFFVFSPRMRQWAAYDASGTLVQTGRGNGGSDYCEELGHPCHSPHGWFSVHSKGSADCISHKFPLGKGGAQMPYCMFFSGGYAIHGSPWIGVHNTSHGCIRVTTQSAEWLSSNFMTVGTRVLVLPY